MNRKTVIVVLFACFAIITTMLARSSERNDLRLENNSKRYAGDSRIYSATVENLHAGWDQIGQGETFYRAGRYDEAVMAFKDAYDIDPRNRVMIGDKLIKAYEKVGKYDKAIAIVDDILNNHHLGERGIKEFNEIRSHLIETKNKSSDMPLN